MPAARIKPVTVPTTTVREFDKELNDYRLGMNNYLANDVLGDGIWRLAQDARMPTLGEYETRKGTDFLSDAAGETQDQSQTSATGAADQSFSETTRLAAKFTAGSTAPCTKVEVRLKNDASATGTVIVALYSDSSGSPGTLLAKSSIAASVPTSSYAYITARFMSAPTLTSGTAYWIVCYVQSTGTGSYKWSSTTSATTAKSSSDSGGTWSSTSYDLNFREYYATSGGTKGIFRGYKSDGTKVHLMAHGTSLYSVDNSTGALTAIKTGLNASASDYRFAIFNDVIYYVNGFDGLRRYNFSTESQVSSTNYTNITVHKGLLFLVDKDDPTKVVFSNFADPETYTSTDFIYVPAPKTGDPVTAVKSLNGFLMMWTRYSKWILSGDDNATFRLDPAIGTKGTFTQETIDSEGNYAYFLSDDGIYRTNGSSDELISQGIYEDIQNLSNKDTCVLSVNKGRIRLWFRPDGQSANTKSFVLNTHFKGDTGTMIESIDTETYVNNALTASQDDFKLIVGSSVVGQIYWQELDTNDYTNLGGDIQFDLRSHYMHFGTPSRTKEVRFWKPRFASQSASYTVTCQYGYDLRDNYQTQSATNIQGSGSIWGSATWGSFTWGTTPELQPDLQIPGSYRRVAVRYYHYASRQPHRFLGHTFTGELRDLR
jgi:hypothetical protein